MKVEQIFLSKNYTVIESPVSFILRFNVRDSSASSAEDTIFFKDGWYIFDNNKLLPYEVDGVYNSPKYNAFIEYDETKLLEGENVRVYTTWVNPKSIESLNSDVLELKAEQFTEIKNRLGYLKNDTEKLTANIFSINSNNYYKDLTYDNLLENLASLTNPLVHIVSKALNINDLYTVVFEGSVIVLICYGRDDYIKIQAMSSSVILLKKFTSTGATQTDVEHNYWTKTIDRNTVLYDYVSKV